MIVIERKQSMWLCATALEAFEVHAVSLRLQGEAKNFKVFQRRLDNYETIEAGVVFACLLHSTELTFQEMQHKKVPIS